MVGLGINVKRFQGSATNPWLVQVQAMPPFDENLFTKRVIDSVYMSKNPEFIQTHEDYEVNCVLPLFNGTENPELINIINTRLYKLLMTFNVTGNIDNIDENAYYSLLSATFLKLTEEKKANEHVKKLKQMILKTFEVLYQTKGEFYKFIEMLENDINEAFVFGKGYKDLGQFVTGLAYLKIVKKTETDELEEILQKSWVEYFWSRRSESRSNLVTFNYEDNIVEKFLKEVEGKKVLENFWTAKDLVTCVNSGKFVHIGKELDKMKVDMANEKTTEVKLAWNGLKGDGFNNINFNMMKKVNKAILGKEVSDNELISYITHSILHKNDNNERGKSAISFDAGYNAKLLIELDFKDSNKDYKKKMEKRISTQILGKAKRAYFDEFKKAHFDTKPMDWETILEKCRLLGLDHKDLKYDHVSKLLGNACQSERCPHFLVPKNKQIRSHMGGWQAKLPRGFHSYVQNHLSLTIDEIYEQFVKERGLKLDYYDVTAEYVKEYIEMVKTGYTG